MNVRTTLPVLAIALLLAACGGGGGDGSPTTPPPPPPPGDATTVQIVGNAFSPQSVVVQPGEIVRWVFVSGTPDHTTTEVNGLWDSGFVFRQPGDSFERRFTQAEAGETFLYRCRTHAACCGMQGSVRVGTAAPPPPPGY